MALNNNNSLIYNLSWNECFPTLNKAYCIVLYCIVLYCIVWIFLLNVCLKTEMTVRNYYCVVWASLYYITPEGVFEYINFLKYSGFFFIIIFLKFGNGAVCSVHNTKFLIFIKMTVANVLVYIWLCFFTVLQNTYKIQYTFILILQFMYLYTCSLN